MGCGLHSPFPLWVIITGEVIYDITCAMCNIIDCIACIVNDITDSVTCVINRIADSIACVIVHVAVVCLVTGCCAVITDIVVIISGVIIWCLCGVVCITCFV